MDPLLDRYELRDRLGRGGMASVYRAYDRQLGRLVAIKLFPPGTAADDARRRGEASALARLAHPHLVTLFDAHLSADGDATPSFLVMELVDGEDLRTRLDAGPLPAEQAAAVASGVADALVVVHGAGMVHRDLKPANILLAAPPVAGRPPVVKLADFGIAHLLGAERLTTEGTIIGTAGYLSPEQLRGGDVGSAADIYALGLVVLEALTGAPQYPGTAMEAVAARAAHDPRVPADLPDGWRGLLLAMTSSDPALRPTAGEVAVMAAEMAPELAGWKPETVAETAATAVSADSALAGATETTAATRLLPAPTRRRRLRVALLAGGGVAVVAAALALGAVLAPTGGPVDTGPTPRPTPSVSAPPQTVSPAVAPTPASTPDLAPSEGGGGPGKGKGNNGNGNSGSGKGNDGKGNSGNSHGNKGHGKG